MFRLYFYLALLTLWSGNSAHYLVPQDNFLPLDSESDQQLDSNQPHLQGASRKLPYTRSRREVELNEKSQYLTNNLEYYPELRNVEDKYGFPQTHQKDNHYTELNKLSPRLYSTINPYRILNVNPTNIFRSKQDEQNILITKFIGAMLNELPHTIFQVYSYPKEFKQHRRTRRQSDLTLFSSDDNRSNLNLGISRSGNVPQFSLSGHQTAWTNPENTARINVNEQVSHTLRSNAVTLGGKAEYQNDRRGNLNLGVIHNTGTGITDLSAGSNVRMYTSPNGNTKLDANAKVTQSIGNPNLPRLQPSVGVTLISRF